MSEPTLTRVMSLSVRIGPGIPQGDTPQGRRIDYPILGGRFAGPGLVGMVPAGGADYCLERDDGSAVLDARYSLRCDDGAIIEVHNSGLLSMTAKGARQAETSWPIADSEYRCRCAPRFHTDDPRYAWLMHHLFIGTVSYPAADAVWIEVFRVD